jgi:threonine dehydrogenase-like Zn-dependent dehydrogenase
MTALAKELRVLSTMTYNAYDGTRDVDDAALLLASEPAIAEAVITHRFALDEAATAFAVAGDRTAGSIKVVLEP